MQSFKENLRDLKKRQGLYFPSHSSTEALSPKELAKLEELRKIADANLLPYLDLVNQELNLHGDIERIEGIYTMRGLTSGLRLTWGKHDHVGKSIEIGVSDGFLHMLYIETGGGSPVIFTSINDHDGSESNKWRQELETQLLTMLGQNRNPFEYRLI